MQSGNEQEWTISQLANGKKQIDVRFSCVSPAVDNQFHHVIIKVAVDPQLLT